MNESNWANNNENNNHDSTIERNLNKITKSMICINLNQIKLKKDGYRIFIVDMRRMI